MKRVILMIIALGSISLSLVAQNAQESIDKLRTESGVDPTRVTSRAGYSVMFYNQTHGNAQINNRLTLNLGINRWSFSLKPDLVSVINQNAGISSFTTGLGDIRFSILNAFFVKDKIALAGSAEFGLPTGKSTFPNQGAYFAVTPALTLSYTINPGLFLAVQPQYSVSMIRNKTYPFLSVLTVRIFVAQFTKSGFFFVLEPRPIYDFTNKQFDLIISPLIGKSLGKGFNLIALSEIPTRKAMIQQRGVLYQLGISKNF